VSTYDELWDIHLQREAEDDHEFDETARRAYYRRVNAHKFLQAQEDRDTGNELDPLLFEEPPEEEEDA
jgi:hypothetical protein